MSARPPVELTVEGHATRTRVRRKPTDARGRPGYIYVEVEVWEGPEATGEPYDVWELPHTLRYSLDDAALLAVRQTPWPVQPAAAVPPESWRPEGAPLKDQEEVTFVVEYTRKSDGAVVRLSGRDMIGKLRAVQAVLGQQIEQPVWLHVHRADHGVREPWSETITMCFTIGRMRSLSVEKVDTVIEETVG